MTSRCPDRGRPSTQKGLRSLPTRGVVLANLLAGLTVCVILISGVAARDAIVVGPPKFSDPGSYAELGAVWGQLVTAVLPLIILVAAYYVAITAALAGNPAGIRRARLWSFSAGSVVVCYIAQAFWLGAWRSMSAGEMLLLLGTAIVLTLPLTINIGFFSPLARRARRSSPA